MSAHLDQTPVTLEKITVKEISKDHYSIHAIGTTSTGGWNSRLEPLVYVTEPSNWVIKAIGEAPHGKMHNDMVTHWEASLTMHLTNKTTEITVEGKNKLSEKVLHTATVR